MRVFFFERYVTRHEILCPNAVKREVRKMHCKSHVVYATSFIFVAQFLGR